MFANDDNGDEECCDDNDNVDDDDFFCMPLSAYYHNFCTWMVEWPIWVLWLEVLYKARDRKDNITHKKS